MAVPYDDMINKSMKLLLINELSCCGGSATDMNGAEFLGSVDTKIYYVQ